MKTAEKYRQSFGQAVRLSLPIITGQLGLVLMGFFDTIQVGGLGVTYMGASGISNSVYFLFNLLAMGVLFAVSPLVSEAFGEKHGWKSIGVFKSATKVAAVLSVFFYLLMLVVIQNFGLLQEGETITVLSQKFLRILNYSTPMLLFFTLGKQMMDGMGRTKVPMTITLIGLVANVTLNWLLIYGHWGFPALGIEGAAIATATSRTLMCVLIFSYIFFDKQIKSLVAEYRLFESKEKSYINRILKIGIPSGLQMFFEVAAFSAGQIMSGWLGEAGLASFQIAISLASITFMMISGLAAAGTIMTGFAYGAKDKEGIRIAGNTIYLLTLVVQLFFAIIFLLFSRQLPALYTTDASVILMASSLIIMAAFFQLSDGFQAVGVGILRGMQDVKLPSFIAFASYWLIMIPLCYVFAFKLNMHVKGIWIGFIAGLSVAAVLLYWRFRYKWKNIQFEEL